MWEKIQWLIITGLKFRTPYPKTAWGVRCCLTSLGISLYSFLNLYINLKDNLIIDAIEFTYREPTILYTLITVGLFLVGMALIYSEWDKKFRHIAKVFISAMPGVAISFPINVLEPSERVLSREAVKLGVNQDSEENIQKQIEVFNAELKADVVKRFILPPDIKKAYVGGLARIPFLVAYGSTLRNQSAQIVYFDKFHRNGEYALLEDFNEKISLKNYDLSPGTSNDVGLALGFTTAISREQLPETLRDSVTILFPNKVAARNLIKNQANLQDVSDEIARIIDNLSSIRNVQRIHLFLSVQSSLAIEIGRRYQEGTHKNWIIHNFNPDKGCYDWALELSNKGLRTFYI